MLKLFRLFLTFFLFIFCILNAYTEASPSKHLNESNQFNFKPQEMVVMPLEEWINIHPNIPEVEQALQSYHSLQAYQQSLANFFLSPNAYFTARLEALDSLIASIPKDQSSDLAKQLLSQAMKKRAYILALPNMLDPRCSFSEEPLSFNTKSLIIKSSYWTEFLDPLHRSGEEMEIYRNLWKASAIPNYFIFLETVENSPLFNKYLPQTHQVKYFYTDQERAKHKVTFKKGIAYYQGKKFDTSELETNFGGKGWGIFVLGNDGEFYVNNYKRYQLHHSSEFAGGDVIAAGEIMAKGGKVLKISNKSGHYSPSLNDLMIALQTLRHKLGSIKGIQVNVILAKGALTLPVRATYEAQALLTKQGELLCSSAQFKWTPLHIAVWKNQFSLAEAAIKNFPIDSRNDPGLTPLHIAVQNDYVEWVALLLKHGADVNILTLDGYTPLHIAALHGNVEAMELLYPHSDPTIRTAKGETLLLLAIKSGNIEAYKYLLEKNCSPDECDSLGNGSLFYAIASKNNEMLLTQMMKAMPEEIYECNLQGANLLHAAAAFGTREIFSMLIEHGLDPLHLDMNKETPLHWAAKYDNGPIVEFLLEYAGWMIGVKDNQGATPLHYGAQHLSPIAFEMLVRASVDLDLPDKQGNTPIFYAIRSEKIRNTAILLTRGANIHHFNHIGDAPIHVLASSPLIPLNLLLCQADDIGLLDGTGNTPLQVALKNGNIANALYLLPYYSKEMIEHANSEGLTAIDLARELNDLSIIQNINLILNTGTN